MSLFGSIQLANNALRANQIGLQVAGQNIANANTPGYIREEAIFSPAPTQRLGRLLLGLGVEVTAIVQKVDRFLEERLRGATSERSGVEVEEQTYLELETRYAELGVTDLSTALTQFFNALHDLADEPESSVARNFVILHGGNLARNVNRLAGHVGQVRSDLNQRVENSVGDINRLIEEVRVLNIRIAEAEGSDTSASEAVGLRDQRQTALTNLAKLVDISVQEQENGTASVFLGGDYLVLDGISRSVKATEYSDRGLQVFELRLEESDSLLQITGGEVAGLIKSRDEVLGGFLDELDNFASALVYEFNRVYSSGQGRTGFQSITSESSVDSTTAALDAAGLSFTPTNGSFQILVHNTTTGLTETNDIPVDLNGLDGDVTLADLAAAIDAVDGISASINSSNQLTITSDSTDLDFAFANDTSGVLTALGINTFFTGDDARSIGINSAVADDSQKFAASRNGVDLDNEIAVELAGFAQQALDSENGLTLYGLYERMTANVAQGSSVAHAVAEGARVFEDQLRGQSAAISGVSIDEEILRMLRYQRSFQASAKYIATLDELLQVLVAL
ncbi:MAG: flagellar hook-associated protein FlgK [Pirellulales bacterium]